jgi:hypothetical protein
MGNLLSHVQFLDFSEALGFNLEQTFESLDAYDRVALNLATILLTNGNVIMTGNASGSSAATLQRLMPLPRVDLTYDKKVILELWGNFQRRAAPDEDIFVRVGNFALAALGFGFHTQNDGIYGHAGDDALSSSLKLIDAGPGAFQWDGILKAVLIPGQQVQFFVDGVYVGLINTHLPSGWFDPLAIFSAYVGPGGATPHVLSFSGFRFYQGQ